MPDLVGTCPKNFWEQWLAEGGLPGEAGDTLRYHWLTNHPLAKAARRGDRFYIVAHGKLRGYAPIVEVEYNEAPDSWVSVAPADFRYSIVRQSGAVACTIPEPIKGFRGLRLRWWKREDEIPFPDWRKP
jgi:hypothetical protein